MVAQGRPSRFALVADDDALIRRVIGMALESAGWTVLEAGDSPTIIDILERHPIGLCVMDRHMPGSSLDARLEILGRRHPRGAVIVLSGASGERPCGRDDIVSLRKPVSLHDLHEGVARALVLADRSPGTARR